MASIPPASQFIIEGFSPPFRLDRNINGGGVFIYVSDLILCNQVKFLSRQDDIEIILGKLSGCYWGVLIRVNIHYFLNHVRTNLDKGMENDDNFLLNGEKQMSDFCLLYDLSNLITEPTCNKYPINRPSIDVILANREN